jgi:hypothetical protein
MCASDTGRTVTEHRASARHNDRQPDHATGHDISNADRLHDTGSTDHSAPDHDPRRADLDTPDTRHAQQSRLPTR